MFFVSLERSHSFSGGEKRELNLPNREGRGLPSKADELHRFLPAPLPFPPDLDSPVDVAQLSRWGQEPSVEWPRCLPSVAPSHQQPSRQRTPPPGILNLQLDAIPTRTIKRSEYP